MSNKSLKSKASKGVLWNSLERLLITFVQFTIGIILARLLTPEDFGLVGILSIFIAVSQVFIDSGMGSGLIQKQDRTDLDFSTVFIFNLAISALCYLILFLGAPYIADFYEMPKLTSLSRVLGLSLIINSLNIVQRTKLEIEVDFKRLAKINVIALFCGGICAVIAALSNFGVWSLVIQTLVISLVSLIGFWIVGNWSFSILFSKESFNKLFNYGYKLLISGVYARILQDIYNLVIGKVYSASELGFFSQAKKLVGISTGMLTSVIHKVSFPILSALQDDKSKMLLVYRRIIKITGFVSFPIMILLCVLAEPLIETLLGEMWLEVIPLFRWLCIAYLTYPLDMINMNILNANGRSDLFLKVDLIKFPLVIGGLIISMPISLEAVVIGQTIVSILSFFINTYLPGKLYKYGGIKQLWDLKKVIISSMVMAISVYLFLTFVDNNFVQIFIGGLIGIGVYIYINYILKSKELKELTSFVKSI